MDSAIMAQSLRWSCNRSNHWCCLHVPLPDAEFLPYPVSFPCLLGAVLAATVSSTRSPWFTDLAPRFGKGLLSGLVLGFGYRFTLSIIAEPVTVRFYEFGNWCPLWCLCGPLGLLVLWCTCSWNWRRGSESDGNRYFDYSVTTSPPPEAPCLITNERQ